jgi:hypothetical protein
MIDLSFKIGKVGGLITCESVLDQHDPIPVDTKCARSLEIVGEPGEIGLYKLSQIKEGEIKLAENKIDNLYWQLQKWKGETYHIYLIQNWLVLLISTEIIGGNVSIRISVRERRLQRIC